MFRKMPIWKKLMIALIALIPAVILLIWWNRVRMAERAVRGIFLAPVNNTPIIATLVLFMAGYMLFLFVMFYDNMQEFIHNNKKK